MPNPAEFSSSMSNWWNSLVNYQFEDETLWNMAFYGMLTSTALPIVLQINRPYTTFMDSLYLAFSKSLLEMIKYWGRSISEPYLYLSGQEKCEYYQLGSWKQVDCHILFF